MMLIPAAFALSAGGIRTRSTGYIEAKRSFPLQCLRAPPSTLYSTHKSALSATLLHPTERKRVSLLDVHSRALASLS